MEKNLLGNIHFPVEPVLGFSNNKYSCDRNERRIVHMYWHSDNFMSACYVVDIANFFHIVVFYLFSFLDIWVQIQLFFICVFII